MSEKPLIKIVNALVCDDVRKEITNKFIIIGIYTGNIVFPDFPATANLSLYAEALIRKTGQVKFNIKISLDNTTIVSADIMIGNNNPEEIASIILPPMPLHFPRESTLRFEISHDNKNWIELAKRRAIKGKTVSIVNVFPPGAAL